MNTLQDSLMLPFPHLQHRAHSCMLNKPAARTAHRADEASASETSVPRLRSLVLIPSRSVSAVVREEGDSVCSPPSLQLTGSSTAFQAPYFLCANFTPVAAQVGMSLWTPLDLRAGP